MKKIILLLIASVIVSASALQTEREIYKTILSALFPEKQTIYIWLDDPEKQEVFNQLMNVVVVEKRERADMLIIYRTYDLKTDKKVFADGYLIFKHYKEKIVGGFYWQKGRPNLVFVKKTLQEHNISLPPNLQEFIEDDF